MKTALLVVDIQTALIEAKPCAVGNCLSVWQKAIATYRKKNIGVIYVRRGDDELLTGSRGREVYEAIAPEVDEKIFDKYYNSAFKGTHLQTYLDNQAIGRPVITSMVTNCCIDTIAKIASESGYNLAVIKNGTTTFTERGITAEQLIRHYESTWNGRFVQVADSGEILKED